jgi:hypothetical protein
MPVQPRWTRILISLVLLGLMANSLAAISQPTDELKSAIILGFLRYSEWPRSASGDTALTVAVLGRPSLARVLGRALDGKLVNGRLVQVLETTIAAKPQNYHVLYVASDTGAEIRQAVAEAHSRHALTIGESDHFLEYGGMVNLMSVDGHMSFEVNLSALGETGIEISSKLLRYGQIKGRQP